MRSDHTNSVLLLSLLGLQLQMIFTINLSADYFLISLSVKAPKVAKSASYNSLKHKMIYLKLLNLFNKWSKMEKYSV